MLERSRAASPRAQTARRPGREFTMRDVLFVAIIIVFFVLCAFYVRALDRS
jgi:energy-coupling factor transporter transmembrane protein EcfT